jgi:tyrosyl-tRNA synthetase
VKQNSKTYIKQLDKILDTKKIKIHFNNKWFDKMRGEDAVDLLSKYTLNKIMTREDFSKRLKSGTDIYSHEILYPILQGYDSLIINSDIEIGGTDQLFNMQVGRHIQSESGLKSQHVLCMPLLRGLDGENKMSKSLNNYVGLCESPNIIEQKIVNMPDHLIDEYIKLLTNFNVKELEDVNSLIKESNNSLVKSLIAKNILKQLNG